MQPTVAARAGVAAALAERLPMRAPLAEAATIAAGVALVYGLWLIRRRRDERVRTQCTCSRPKRAWKHGVEVRASLIQGAGDGLFASRSFAEGELLGEYYGRVLSLLQAHQLEDRDYLMGGFGVNAHVDARFTLDSPARYVNDHFDRSKLNAHFEKMKPQRRARLVALREIAAGEEIYASYGESYWRARGINPETGSPF